MLFLSNSEPCSLVETLGDGDSVGPRNSALPGRGGMTTLSIGYVGPGIPHLGDCRGLGISGNSAPR